MRRDMAAGRQSFLKFLPAETETTVRSCLSFGFLFSTAFSLIGASSTIAAPPQLTGIAVNPKSLQLNGPEARMLLLVDGTMRSGRVVDVRRQAEFRSANSKVAEVSPNGVVRSVSDGKTTVRVTVDNHTVNVPVVVSKSQQSRRFHFENDIIPIFSKFGCNSGGCHGKAEGQNGFKLSVFGFDPPADWKSLISESRGRRVNPAMPERSLLLTKASGGVPHGGGVRIRRGSGEYRLLRDWIAAGMPLGDSDAPHVVALTVTPKERGLTMKSQQQLRVIARYSDGREVDVTRHAKFQTNNESLATVDEFGLVTAGDLPGDAAIMASYMGAVDIFRTLIPGTHGSNKYPKPPVRNFIDQHVDAKLRKLNIAASGVCDDATFVRRVFLDVIGTLPTADESRAFLDNKRPDKREKLVESLMKRPEFADYWALKWSDLLRVDRQALGHKGAYQFYSWIRGSIADNKPYNRFVNELLTADGPLRDAPAGQFYRVVNKPGEAASTLSQVLLGVRIECAQCHHHPFDRWSQTDYYGMQAYFTQVGFKSTPQGNMLTAFGKSATKHPRTQTVVFAHPLGTKNPAESPDGDRRRLLAAWMTSPKNPWLAQNIANRTWAHFTGRGLIEPVDDIRSTNPPSNPELLDALAADFIKHGYDFRHLIRRITSSRTYQLSTQTNPTNERDEQNYSRALFKRMDAEVLLDAVCQTTGVPEKFHGVPGGSRAIQLWDSHVPHDFLKLFGRPVRATACECERVSAPTVSQVLHVLNSPRLHGKISHAGGRIARLSANITNDAELIDELYLTFYSRYPSKDERQSTVRYLEKHKTTRRRAVEDLAWSMMNTVEFLMNR